MHSRSRKLRSLVYEDSESRFDLFWWRQHPYLCREQTGWESHIVHVCAVVSRPVLRCQDTHTCTKNSPNQFLQTLYPSFPFHWLDATPQQPRPDYYRNPFRNLKVASQKLHKTLHPVIRKWALSWLTVMWNDTSRRRTRHHAWPNAILTRQWRLKCCGIVTSGMPSPVCSASAGIFPQPLGGWPGNVEQMSQTAIVNSIGFFQSFFFFAVVVFLFFKLIIRPTKFHYFSPDIIGRHPCSLLFVAFLVLSHYRDIKGPIFMSSLTDLEALCGKYFMVD